MNAAVYARFSSSEQSGTLTIESQIRACKEHALKHGWRIGEVYVDRGIPGSRDLSRPGFQRMICDAQKKQRPFDVILVWKYSRFFRDRYKSAVYKGLLRQHRVDVVSVTEPVDKDSASGVLMEGMIELIDQFYSASLSEETRRGLKENVLAGYRVGSAAPYGYRRERVEGPGGKSKTVIVPNPDQAPTLRRIFEEYASGRAGLKRIAYRLNEGGVSSPRGSSWDPSSIRSILKNEVYLGWGVLGKRRYFLGPNDRVSRRDPPREEWTVNENAHEPLIDRDLWDRVQKQFERSQRPHLTGGPQIRGKYLLSGILKCAGCGSNFTTYKTRKRDRSWWYAYVCGRRKYRGRAACDNTLEIPHEPFNRKIIENLVEVLVEEKYVEEVARQVNQKIYELVTNAGDEIHSVRNELKSVIRRLDLCVEAVLNGEFQHVRDKMTILEKQRAALEQRLVDLQAAAGEQQLMFSIRQVKEIQKELIAELTLAEGEQLRRYLLGIFDYIKVYPSGKLEYHFNPEGLFPASASSHLGLVHRPVFIHNANLQAVLATGT